jgi:hypothetical protein
MPPLTVSEDEIVRLADALEGGLDVVAGATGPPRPS